MESPKTSMSVIWNHPNGLSATQSAQTDGKSVHLELQSDSQENDAKYPVKQDAKNKTGILSSAGHLKGISNASARQ